MLLEIAFDNCSALPWPWGGGRQVGSKKIGWKADDGTSAEMLEVGENVGMPGLAKGESDQGEKKPTIGDDITGPLIIGDPDEAGGPAKQSGAKPRTSGR